MSWLSAIIAEARRALVLCRILHLLELKTKNFFQSPFVVREREMVFQVKSGENIVSHFILFLLTRKERPHFSQLINTELKTTAVSTSEVRS